MTHTITILAIVLVGFGMSSVYACSDEDIQHWVTYQAAPGITDFHHATEPSIGGSPFTIPLDTQGSQIVSTDNIQQRIADRMNDLGYFADLNNPRPLMKDDISVGTVSDTGGYAINCKDDFTQVIGGMLLQPDSTAMFLAYGMANAIWMAPLAGIAAGVYLTRNKWKR